MTKPFSPAWLLGIWLLGCGCVPLASSERSARLAAYSALSFQPLELYIYSEKQSLSAKEPKPEALERDLVGELNAPSFADLEYRVQTHISAIRIAARRRVAQLQDDVTGYETPSAERYFERGQVLAQGNPELMALLLHAQGTFLLASGQSSKAGSLFQHGLALQRERPSALVSALLHDGLSEVFDRAGDFGNAAQHRNNSLQVIRARIQQAAHAIPLSEWREYAEIYLHILEDAESQSRASNEKWPIWLELKPILDHKFQPPDRLEGYRRAAAAMLRVDTMLLDEAHAILRGVPRGPHEKFEDAIKDSAMAVLFQCLQGRLLLKQKQSGSAIRYLDYCDNFRNTQDLETLYDVALAHEREGHWTQASQHYEKIKEGAERERAQLSFKERLTYFERWLRHAYHGSLRTRLAGRTVVQDPAEVSDLLGLADATLARQLQDRLREHTSFQTPVTIASIRAQLSPSEMLLHFATLDDRLIRTVVSQDRQETRILSVQLTELRGELARVQRLLFKAGGHEALKLLEGLLSKLSRALLEGLDPHWLVSSASRLHIVAEEPVSLLPFDLLALPRPARSTYRPLLADFAISTHPAAALLTAGRRLSPSPRLLGLAISKGDRRKVEELADAPIELQQSAQVYPRPVVTEREKCSSSHHCLLEDSQADKRWFLSTDLRPFQIVQLATHAFGVHEEGLSEPAILLARDIRGVPGDVTNADVLLTVSEAEQLRIQPELVILSACGTGRGPSVAGEGPLTLSRAFLLRSPTVLMTLWPVPSSATRKLMVAFHQHLRALGGDYAAALRQAKLDMLRSNGDEPCYGHVTRSAVEAPTPVDTPEPTLCRHPYFWAAPTLVQR